MCNGMSRKKMVWNMSCILACIAASALVGAGLVALVASFFLSGIGVQ